MKPAKKESPVKGAAYAFLISPCGDHARARKGLSKRCKNASVVHSIYKLLSRVTTCTMIQEMKPQDSTRPSAYTERAVGFIDILGFADLVRQADKEPALREQIIEALGKVRSTAAPGDEQTDLRAQNFSDSLILSAKPTAVGLWHLLLSTDALAWNLLQLGILIRGGDARESIIRCQSIDSAQ